MRQRIGVFVEINEPFHADVHRGPHAVRDNDRRASVGGNIPSNYYSIDSKRLIELRNAAPHQSALSVQLTDRSKGHGDVPQI